MNQEGSELNLQPRGCVPLLAFGNLLKVISVGAGVAKYAFLVHRANEVGLINNPNASDDIFKSFFFGLGIYLAGKVIETAGKVLVSPSDDVKS
jgi:hypothetical protein